MMKLSYFKKGRQTLATTKRPLMRPGKIVKKYIDKKGGAALVYIIIGQT